MCNYCHIRGHSREKCYKLHGDPPHANTTHTNNSQLGDSNEQSQNRTLLIRDDYDDYLKYHASKQSFTLVATITHFDNSIISFNLYL